MSAPLYKPIPRSLQAFLVIVATIAVFGGFAHIWPYVDDAGLSQTRLYNAKSSTPAHGELLAKTRCFACHGADGNSLNPLYPKLASQSADFIYTQLLAFKTGDRPSTIMSGIADALSAQDAQDVATYYARQTLKPDPVTNQQLAARGEQVFYARSGMGMMSSSCAACHEGDGRQRTQMMGMMSRRMGGMMLSSDTAQDIGRLNGQHAAYILKQLDDFASGQRPSTVMTPIAGRLDEADRKAVAEYLSGLH